MTSDQEGRQARYPGCSTGGGIGLGVVTVRLGHQAVPGPNLPLAPELELSCPA